MEQQTLQTYPCEYTFKVFGAVSVQEKLSQQVLNTVNEEVEIADDGISHRNSSAGKYFCISVNVLLKSEEQRRWIYIQLQQLEGVRYIL